MSLFEDARTPEDVRAHVDKVVAAAEASVAESARGGPERAAILAAAGAAVESAKSVADAAAPESEEVPVATTIVVRVPAGDNDESSDDEPPVRAAQDAESESDDEEPAPKPREIRLPRKLAGVCDEGTWRKFVPAVFAHVTAVARRVVGDDDADVVPFVRAAIEGMSFSSESARFSTLGMDVAVPSATPQCVDLLGGLLRVTAKRAAHNAEYAKLFDAPAALQKHLEDTGARVCVLPFTQVWMVIAAASARADVWQPVMRRRKADDPDAAAVAAYAQLLDPVPEEAPPPVRRASGPLEPRSFGPGLRAGRRKRKREDE